ncbi:hypothetical protein HOI71_11485, partial [Candidatus Poribacteria bacterium]|nr:hypothetical protein [Candidatus Poribacteria bacterium]
MATELEQVIRGIEKLTPSEQRQVRDALDDLLRPPDEPTALQQRLMEAGLLRHIGNARQRAEHI